MIFAGRNSCIFNNARLAVRFATCRASPAFYDPSENAVPMAPVVVEMEEGVRLLSNMVDCPPDELHIDMAVEVTYEKVTDEVTLPRFRRAK
jgi:uncharacterized OB-fold protein